MIRADDALLLDEREVGFAETTIRPPVFSPDGTLLVISSDGNEIVVRRAGDLVNVFTLSGHADAVLDVAFSPDGTRLVSAAADFKLKVWDVATGRELATLHGHESNVVCVQFLDGDTIVSGGWDGVRFWDAAPFAGNSQAHWQ